MQSKQEIENWYSSSDPWGYKTNPDDIERKKRILAAIPSKEYRRALDVGCGEAWITKDLPSDNIYGLELSDSAAERFPKNVKRVLEPNGYYDLILASGVLYPQYDFQQMLSWIISHSTPKGIIVTCHIKAWEQELPLKPISVEEFPYRDWVESLKVYQL